MRLPESGRGFSSAEFFKRRIEWRDRAESAFSGAGLEGLQPGKQATVDDKTNPASMRLII